MTEFNLYRALAFVSIIAVCVLSSILIADIVGRYPLLHEQLHRDVFRLHGIESTTYELDEGFFTVPHNTSFDDPDFKSSRYFNIWVDIIGYHFIILVQVLSLFLVSVLFLSAVVAWKFLNL